jgi:gamma-glutamylcyclotransferase
MPDEAHWYFAYGSNMQAATFRGRRALEPLAARVGFLDGHALRFDIPVGPGLRGVANLAVEAASFVWGVLYLLRPEQHAHLDRTEGVPSGLYRRVPVSIRAGEQWIAAETYISEIRDAARLPSHRYLGLLLDGAREHGLPASWIATLETWPLAFDEREGATNPPGAATR